MMRSNLALPRILGISLVSLLLTACPLDEIGVDEGVDETIEQEVNENAPNAPKVTMSLPVTLSNVVTLGDQTPSEKIRAREQNEPNCEQHMDDSANPMVDGYSMAKFLVGISQSQSCMADFLIEQVLLSASYTVGQGLIALPENPNDPGAPSHIKVDQSGDTYSVWMFFLETAQVIDETTDPHMFMTWTTLGSDTTGQFFWVNLSNPSDPGAPKNLRVDFERHEGSASNKIFLNFREEAAFDGFRIDVSQQGSGDSATYFVKGLLNFVKQPADNLPSSETYVLPELRVSAVLNADGAGAADWQIAEFAMDQRVPDSENPGQYLLSVGTYYMDISTRSYFDTTGSVTWITRGLEDGRYINTSGTNTRFNATDWITCMESDSLDCDSDSTNELSWPGLNQPGYFTDTCSDTDGAECTDFVQIYYDNGSFDSFLGSITNGDAIDEPADGRKSDLDTMVALEQTHADGETKAVLFTTPAP